MMDPKHKEKINEAIDVCEKAFKDLSKHFEEKLIKQDSMKLQYFFLQNTVFAGGLFRSVFSDTAINDVDIFFTSPDAAIEFRHMMKTKDFNPAFTHDMISKANSFNLKRKGKPMVSIVTQRADEPNLLIQGFDFTFNQHYFSIQDYEMSFDVDTFNKMGTVLNAKKTPPGQFYFRAMRFLQEGFKLDRHALVVVGNTLTQLGKSSEGEFVNLQDTIKADSYGGDTSGLLKIERTGIAYTGDDYYQIPKKEIKYDYVPAALRGITIGGGGGGATTTRIVNTERPQGARRAENNRPTTDRDLRAEVNAQVFPPHLQEAQAVNWVEQVVFPPGQVVREEADDMGIVRDNPLDDRF